MIAGIERCLNVVVRNNGSKMRYDVNCSRGNKWG